MIQPRLALLSPDFVLKLVVWLWVAELVLEVEGVGGSSRSG